MARLKDSYELGGAQLVDVRDKVCSQRIGWLLKLISLPQDAFPRVVAEALIGDQGCGYKGLDILKADLNQFPLRSQGRGHPMAPGGFYWDAIRSWIRLTPKISLKQDLLYNKQFFYNPMIK